MLCNSHPACQGAFFVFGACIVITTAQASHDKNLSALDGAGKKERAAAQTHATASALFLKNPADSSAMNELSMAIDRMVAAKEGWKAAEQAVAGSQKVLSFAQYRLDMKNQQAMADLSVEVKQEIDQKAKGVIKEYMPTGKVSPDVSNFMDKAENKSFTLASGNESGIIREDGQTLGTGTVTTIPGMGNLPFQALASRGVASDGGYNDEYLDVLALSGLSSSSGGGGKGPEYGPDGDVELYWKDMHPGQLPALPPTPTLTPSPTPEPTLTPSTTPTPICRCTRPILGERAVMHSI